LADSWWPLEKVEKKTVVLQMLGRRGKGRTSLNAKDLIKSKGGEVVGFV